MTVTSEPATSSTTPGSTVTTTSAPLPTTTLPIVPTTTTTLPDFCSLVAMGATFDSLECRLDAVGTAVRALGAVTPRAPAFASRLGQANDLEERARTSCGNGDVRGAKKTLKGSFKKLGALRGLLAAKKSRTVPGRDALVADVTAIRNDVRALKQRLSCPADATSVE